jgi:uncharacterized glyoxalase superfamily metalloenzyme YdcJ
MIDAFFTAAKRPATGSGKDQAVASAPIRVTSGAVIRWHALLTDEQWAYHSTRGAKLFVADIALAGKAGAPAHFFCGSPVVDQAAKKIYEPGKPARDIVDVVAPPPKEATNELAIPTDSVDR